MDNITKLLFFDIDGTLAYAGSPPLPSTLDALTKARKNGCKIFLSTGRPDRLIPPAIEALKPDGGIYSAGAKIIYDGTSLYDRPMTNEEMNDIISILDQYKLPYCLEAAYASYEKGMDILDNQEDSAFLNSELRRLIDMRTSFISGSRPVSAYVDDPVYKITFMSPDMDTILSVKEALGDQVTFVWFPMPRNELNILNGEISLKGIDKGVALLKICDHLGLTKDDCIAFGDSMNDAAMLKTAGIGVAMGNADAATKAVADRVCEDCDQDGIAKELTRLGLV